MESNQRENLTVRAYADAPVGSESPDEWTIAATDGRWPVAIRKDANRIIVIAATPNVRRVRAEDISKFLFAQGRRQLLFGAATHDRDAHILIGRRFINQTRQLAYAGHRFAIEANDHVVLAQAGFFCRTVLGNFGHADAAHFTQAIAGHVLFSDVLSADAQKGAAIEKE